MKSAYSDEMINAFVDDELDKEERLAFKQLIEQDQGLYHRVRNICEIKRRLKRVIAIFLYRKIGRFVNPAEMFPGLR